VLIHQQFHLPLRWSIGHKPGSKLEKERKKKILGEKMMISLL
jgi:hypothetical protein